MCSICGIVSSDPDYPISESALLMMRDIVEHRGPDDSGYYLAPGIGLASGRLAILDLSDRGHMPMVTPDGRYRIVHNGEIYNYRELRLDLEARGYSFHSNTDTEVLLWLYIADGPKMLNRLNGMFAFAIWDSHERKLFVARDRLGVKPFYYAHYDNVLYFASEEKALFAAGVPCRFDHDTWQELLCFRYVAGERTPFIGVQRLLPGHYFVWRDGKIQIRRWWNLSERAHALRESLPDDPVAWFRETFDDSVNLRRISDVPVGVLLSGGLDSTSVAAALALQAGSGVATFTVCFDDVAYDEGPLARQVAEQWKLARHELVISPQNLLGKLREAAWFNDEPQVHGNDPHLLSISQYAKSRVTVLLSGEGADETLGGYVRYQPLRYRAALSLAQIVLPQLSQRINMSSRWRKLQRFLQLGSLRDFVLFNSCEVLPDEIVTLGLSRKANLSYRRCVLAEAERLYPGELVRHAMYSDQHTFLCSLLDRNDRMTMGASVECRVPFLDYRLVEMLAALPSSVLFMGNRPKGLLRSALGSRLPSAVLRHRKWGFGVPWKQYFRDGEEFRSLLSALPNASILLDSPIEQTAVREQVKSFLTGKNDSFAVLMQLVMIVLGWEAVNRTSDVTQRSVLARCGGSRN